MSDPVRKHFGSQSKTLSREGLDAKGGLRCPPTFWQHVADQCNNPDFKPSTEAFPSLHSNFSKSRTLTIEGMPVPTMAERCQKMFASECTAAKAIKQRWSRSGEGEGNLDDDGNHVSHKKSDCISGCHPRHLCFWEAMSKCGLLDGCVAMLSEEASADSDSAASTAGKRKQREAMAIEKTMAKAQQSLAILIKTLSSASAGDNDLRANENILRAVFEFD